MNSHSMVEKGVQRCGVVSLELEIIEQRDAEIARLQSKLTELNPMFIEAVSKLAHVSAKIGVAGDLTLDEYRRKVDAHFHDQLEPSCVRNDQPGQLAKINHAIPSHAECSLRPNSP